MNSNEMEQDKIKNAYGRKYIIPAVILLILITPIIYFIHLKSKPDPVSEKAIRNSAADQLDKDQNILDNRDFTNITELTISNNNKFIEFASLYDFTGNAKSMDEYSGSLTGEFSNLIDIKLLKNFINLQELNIRITIHDGSNTSDSKTQEILKKLGIHKSTVMYEMDLSPLENLVNLRELKLFGVPFRDIKPLENLSNLESLWFATPRVKSLEPLEKLTNLKNLTLQRTSIIISEPEQIRYLKNLDFLALEYSSPKNLKPISNLTNLKILKIRYNYSLSNLDSLKEMANLKKLYIQDCPEITDQEIEDLQKALPNLEIIRQK
ncbi:MAG: hypothetical protein JXA96_08295 [Sedimentisphaerales bacterium]|nr:hypothetical protein [Sedimentisphaerales bacterium]